MRMGHHPIEAAGSAGLRMKITLKSKCAALATASLIVLTGCTAISPQAGTTQMTGIACNKCESVWLPRAGTGGKPGRGYDVYRASRRMICPQCESAAATFFRTGKFEHKCPGCGGNITRCTAQVVGRSGATNP